jgi:predicted amidohydrolase
MTELNITIVQSYLQWEQPKANRLHFNQLLQSVGKTDVIVLPELFTTAFCLNAKAESMSGKSIQWMLEHSKEKEALVIGSILVEENGSIYNRLICAFPDGSLQHYDKRHLFGMMNESDYITKGDKRITLEYKGWNICPLICYDLRFPVYSRNNDDYDVLIYVANWPVKRIEHWNKLLVARAIENQSYVVGVNRVGEDINGINYNGQSALIDANGHIIYIGGENEDVKTVVISKDDLQSVRSKLPFLKDADAFTIH